MNIKKMTFVMAVAAMATGTSFGAGFGLYEASARGNALGGGLVGSTGDATANYYNPANLTECTNISVTVGVSLINPFADAKVDGVQQPKMNAGWFPPPHAYVAAPLTKDLVFGFGTYCEYGLGTKYDNSWPLKFDTTETTIEQFTFNPNIAYKITEDWSVAFGARMSYIAFENYKSPIVGMHPLAGAVYGRSHLKGDDFNCGYMLATQYKITDDLSFGAVYRSRINHRIAGDFDLNTPAGMISGDADAKLTLPASVVMGLNYDITERFRGGVSVTWTEWSTVNHLDYNLPTGLITQELNWHDAWRVGFGFEYDFTDNFCGRIGYTYDCDPSAEAHGTTMLPPGDRHIVGFGIGYKFFDNWNIDLGYNFIMMESETRMVEGHKFQCDNSYSHIASLSVTYNF
jgi:long-chain fatty acid transport protein